MNNKVLGVATRVMLMAIIISVILLFVGIGFLVLIHVCIVRRAFRRGINNGNTIERGSLGSTCMSQDDLEKLPCFDFKERDDQKGTRNPVDCAVCLENFKVGDKCRLLPLCKHSFHADCVDLWLLKTPICPICRTNTEYAWKGGSASASGEESGHFSTDESGVELMESQTTDSGRLSEIAVELREGQTTDSRRLSDSGRVETTESQTVGISSHSICEAGVEPISENQTTRFGSSQLNSV